MDKDLLEERIDIDPDIEKEISQLQEAKLNATIKDKIQEIILNNSLTNPLKVATMQDVRIIPKTIMSIILKYRLLKYSISLYYLY